jgi:hypothetical protein
MEEKKVPPKSPQKTKSILKQPKQAMVDQSTTFNIAAT